ncbi:Hypothetical protein A7982_00337 [Minicystis rosea]|nr:Hypothetical protein A7982_00337 [Minicystis rosea]
MLRALPLLAFVLVAGCAETVTQPPIAAAPRPTTWQQFCEQAWNVQHANALASMRGSEGFELVAMYNGVLCYKRPRVDAAPHQTPPTNASAPPSGTTFVPLVRDPGF